MNEAKPASENARNPTLADVRELLQSIAKGALAFHEKLENLTVAAGPFIARLQSNLQQLPGRTSAVQRALAERGWFLPPHVPAMSFMEIVENHVAAGRGDELDELMLGVIERQLTEIEADIVQAYPHRAAIFREAFEAHRKGMYAASITLLFTQADAPSRCHTAPRSYAPAGRVYPPVHAGAAILLRLRSVPASKGLRVCAESPETSEAT